MTDDLRGRTDKSSDAYVNRSLWTDIRSEKGNSTDSFRLPTTITGALTLEQISAYQAMFRIQEISYLLKSEALEPPNIKHRSQSPPPIYDAEGKRTNTREQRYRKKLQEERHRLVEIALKTIPYFEAPTEYVKPSNFQDKYYIPVEQYPGINFVGLLLGPRGSTLKQLQKDSKCKIAIRGRGSVKEGKNSNDLPEGAMNMEDPLHCLIIADSEDKIQDGIKACQAVVIKAVTSPEGQNDLKRGQLRHLAELNGTLREDNRPCTTCGLQGHKRYDCPNKESFAQKVLCQRCGQPGHATRDCLSQFPTDGAATYPQSGILSNGYSNRHTGHEELLQQSEQQRLVSDSRYQNQPGQVGRYQSRFRTSQNGSNDYVGHNNTYKSYDMSYSNGSYNNNNRNSSRNQQGYQSNYSTYKSGRIDTQPQTPYSRNTPSQSNRNLVPPAMLYDDPESITETTTNGHLQQPPPNDTLNAPPGVPGLENIDMESITEIPGLGLPPGLSENGDDESTRFPPGLSGPPGL